MRARGWSGWWLIALGGCWTPQGDMLPTAPLPATALPVSRELPRVLTRPAPPVLDGRGLPEREAAAAKERPASSYRLLSVRECQQRAAAAAALANSWDAANRTIAGDRLDARFRYLAALESRNQAVADALSLYYQLAAAEARRPLLRQSLAVVESLLAKAQIARAEKIPYPLEPEDLLLQRSQLRDQVEQLELGIRLLNIELKRRLDWPAEPLSEQFWPVDDFAVSEESLPPDQAAVLALADRPELRAWRLVRDHLTVQTAAQWRELGGMAAEPRPFGGLRRGREGGGSGWLALVLRHKRPQPDLANQVERWREQVRLLLEQRERAIADEARTAALLLPEQTRRVAAARQRLQLWDQRLEQALRRREAGQPNAEVYEAQIRWQRLLAEAELIEQVAAWHQARVRLRAALGWYAYDQLPPPSAAAAPSVSGSHR
jgi:outer membrane protein TolC